MISKQTPLIDQLICDIRISNRYLPALFYLPSTALFIGAAMSYNFYTFGMVQHLDSNLQPPATTPLTTELSKLMSGLMSLCYKKSQNTKVPEGGTFFYPTRLAPRLLYMHADDYLRRFMFVEIPFKHFKRSKNRFIYLFLPIY